MASNPLPIVLLSLATGLGTGCRCTRTCVESPFPGLKAELRQANTNGAWLRLLIVHGMSNHTQGYSSNFVDSIARKLKLDRTRTDVTGLTDPAGNLNGYLTTIDLTRNATNKLRAYELTWSPATYAEKASRFEFDSRLNPKRASLNRKIKSELLNDGFADAVLYLNSQFRPKIQEPVTNAIFRILADDFTTKDLFVIITHSLGSKLTFDCLNLLREQLSRAGQEQAITLPNLATRTSYVIMLANQVPLLRLGETNLVTDHWAQPKASAVQQFLDMRRQAIEPQGPNATLPTLKIVAVSDPNDLLSYPLRRDDLVSEDPNQTIDFGNVFMCNAPAFVGWVANPLIAHEGYFENPKLVKLLLNGYKGKPRICLKEPPTKSP